MSTTKVSPATKLFSSLLYRHLETLLSYLYYLPLSQHSVLVSILKDIMEKDLVIVPTRFRFTKKNVSLTTTRYLKGLSSVVFHIPCREVHHQV